MNPSEWTGPTGNNTYLFPGAPSILIDAGVGHPEDVGAIASALDGAPLDMVLITHGHKDHAAGVPALLERWPHLRVLGAGGEPIHNGDVFENSEVRLSALHTPGHAPDHFCFVDARSGDIFCGDLARAGGTIVIPTSTGGDLRAYLDSLRLVRGMHPPRLLPAHGPLIDEPTVVLDMYLAHRAEREAQVRAALAAGCLTADEIVARIYPRLSSGLIPAARESVLAHLQKIREDDGRSS
jgi:glyoxylase-like metal-dependent hydrolase (beta-lactamase superfamily II)